MDDSKGDTAPALGISVNAQVAPTRQITMQSFIDRDAPGADIDTLLDKLNASLDRQVAFYEIDEEEKRLEVDRNVLANVSKRLAEVEDNIRIKAGSVEGRRNPLKLSSQEEMQKKQAYDSLEEAKRRVAVGEARIVELRKKAGNRDGANSSPNH
jgi:hypothetical protein